MTKHNLCNLQNKLVTLFDLVEQIQKNLKGTDFRFLQWNVFAGIIGIRITNVFNPISDINTPQDFSDKTIAIFSERGISGKSFEHLLCMIRLKFPGTTFQKLVLKSDLNGEIEVTKIK